VNSMIKVARYHLAQPAMLLWVPWAPVAGTFAFSAIRQGAVSSGGLVILFVMFFVAGWQRAGRWLPLGLALGAPRRSFYAGTALLGVSIALVDGLVIAGLQSVERATGGWGLSITFFRVPEMLNGPWYDTWLTSFVGLSALFAYGMWFGIVNRRWGVLGLIAFIAAQFLAGLVYALTGRPGNLTGLGALGLTGVAAALTVVFLAGGHATIRRAAV